MKKRIISSTVAVVLGAVVYFTKTLWMPVEVSNEEAVVDSGNVFSGAIDIMTGIEDTGITQQENDDVVWLGNIDGSTINHGDYPKYPDRQKHYSFGCSFYALMPSIQDKTLKHGSGVVSCSNGLKINFEIITKDGSIIVYDNSGKKLGNFYYGTSDPNADDSDYAFFGSGEYLIDSRFGGDSYDWSESTQYINIHNGLSYEVSVIGNSRDGGFLLRLTNANGSIGFEYLYEKIENGNVPAAVRENMRGDEKTYKLLGYKITEIVHGKTISSNILLKNPIILYPGPDCSACTNLSGLDYTLDIPNNKLIVTFQNANTKSATVDLSTFEMNVE